MAKKTFPLQLASITGCLLLAWAAMAQSTGTITGKLEDEKGAIFAPGAGLTAVSMPDTPKNFTPFAAQVQTNLDGSYRLENLPPGPHEISVQPLAGEYVDNCRWGKPDAIATVEGTGVLPLSLRPTRGKVFTIEVDDGDQFLDGHEGKSPGGALFAGVTMPSKEFLKATVTQHTKLKRTHQVIVPVEAQLQVRVSSPFFEHISEKGDLEPMQVVLYISRHFTEKEPAKGIKSRVASTKPINSSI